MMGCIRTTYIGLGTAALLLLGAAGFPADNAKPAHAEYAASASQGNGNSPQDDSAWG